MHILNNLHKLQSLLIDQHLDAILISSPANLYYTSGFICLSPLEREAYILVTREQTYLVTSPLYAGDTTLSREILLQKAENASLETTVTALLKNGEIKKIGFEERFLSVAEYTQMQREGIIFTPLRLRTLRIEKNPEEIACIERACDIGDETFSFIAEKIKPGMSEKDIASEMEIFIRRKHAVSSFPPIIAFGKNAAIPHHVTGNQKLTKNTFVLLDFGVKIDEYCSDMTRTIYLGKPTSEEKNMYETVLGAQKRAIDYIQRHCDPRFGGNTVTAATADKIAREYIKTQGFPDFQHTLGHGIGLEVHEAPSLSLHSKDELKAGMVFSVEPGIYLQGKAGVRIEDLMVIEMTGARLLTQAPRELIVI